MTARRGPAVWAAFLWPAGHHHAAWRLPDSRSDEVHSLDMYLEMARTADLTALARPRSWATTTSDVSASAGATGRVRKTPPRKKRGMVMLNVVLTKAGMRTMVATIELAATT